MLWGIHSNSNNFDYDTCCYASCVNVYINQNSSLKRIKEIRMIHVAM